MNDSLIRKFCESRYRIPILLTAMLLLALATVLPQVDEYFDTSNDRSRVSEELAAARETALRLPEFEKRVSTIVGELQGLEVRAIGEEAIPRYRSRLVEVVRDSGCQIRRIDIGTPSTRAWNANDEPLAEAAENRGKPTPFALERRSLVLAVDGSMAEIHKLLAAFEKEQTLAHAHRVQLTPVSGGGDAVTLELELWLFSLARAAEAPPD